MKIESDIRIIIKISHTPTASILNAVDDFCSIGALEFCSLLQTLKFRIQKIFRSRRLNFTKIEGEHT